MCCTMGVFHSRHLRCAAMFGSVALMTMFVGTAEAAAPFRVAAIGDQKHTYDGFKHPLAEVALPIVLGAEGAVAFGSYGADGFGSLMEKGGKLVPIDPAGARVLARFGDHVVYVGVTGDTQDQLKIVDGKDGSRTTAIERGETIDGAVVGSLSLVRANERGDLLVTDANRNVYAIAYKGARQLLSRGAGEGYGLDAQGRFTLVVDDPVNPKTNVVHGQIGALGSILPWWDQVPSDHNASYSPVWPKLAAIGRSGLAVGYADPIMAPNGEPSARICAGAIGSPTKVVDRKPPRGMRSIGSTAGASDACMLRNNDFVFDEPVPDVPNGDQALIIVENGTPRPLVDKDTPPVDGFKFKMDNERTAFVASNGLGQLAFVRDVTDGFATLRGLFLYTPSKGITTVMRVGEVITLEPNHEVKVFGIAMTRGCNAGENIVLDDSGRIAFLVEYEELATGARASAVLVTGAAPGAAEVDGIDVAVFEITQTHAPRNDSANVAIHLVNHGRKESGSISFTVDTVGHDPSGVKLPAQPKAVRVAGVECRAERYAHYVCPAQAGPLQPEEHAFVSLDVEGDYTYTVNVTAVVADDAVPANNTNSGEARIYLTDALNPVYQDESRSGCLAAGQTPRPATAIGALLALAGAFVRRRLARRG